MKRQKPDPRLLCCASIIALSLNACTQYGNKLKNDVSLTDKSEASSTWSSKKSRTLRVAKNGSRWFRKKDAGGPSANGKNPSGYDNLWDRLFDLYDLPPIEHEDIDRELEWFVNHPSYIDRVQTRAEPFLYSIVRQFEKYEIPGEIALLPVIESAFQPHAVSPANAAGIWQFIPSTGRLYGLKQNRTYDGRRDVYASTRAAIKYLKKLHSDFNGDWLLALAAYNCGEGAVARAIQRNLARNLPTDFWSLDLPDETRSYVPRLLAVAKLFAGADQYGIDLHHIPNAALFKTVKVNSQLNLALAADAADIPLDKLQELNPGFKHKIADVDGSYRLFVPAEKTTEFKQALNRLAQESTVLARNDYATDSGKSVEASRNGSRGDIAEPLLATHGSRDRNLVLASFGKDRRDTAKGRENEAAAPKTSKIVQKIRGAQSTAAAADEGKSEDRSTKKTGYTVQAGDTLWSIARKHGVDMQQLLKWNNLSEKKGVKPGQKLVFWDKDAGKKLTIATAGFKPSQSISYKVQEGDTLFSISRRFKVSVADLRKWNGSRIEKQMQPGKNITVQRDKD
jgi:membrane-bound lytic murein transglycosylase D